MSQYPQRIGEPDCRDYLRTGRCKYGDSCKYHHPIGGVQTSDPNEPPHPIRPDEPLCQYYLKNGTCKFGQTCKFHHPPHLIKSPGSSASGPTSVCSPCPDISTQMHPNPSRHSYGHGLSHGHKPYDRLMNNSNHDVNDLALLPQRPGEPDCIYFLKHGRCKYGITCKYHHPGLDGSGNSNMKLNMNMGHGQSSYLGMNPKQSLSQSHSMSLYRDRSASTGSLTEVKEGSVLRGVATASAHLSHQHPIFSQPGNHMDPQSQRRVVDSVPRRGDGLDTINNAYHHRQFNSNPSSHNNNQILDSGQVQGHGHHIAQRYYLPQHPNMINTNGMNNVNGHISGTPDGSPKLGSPSVTSSTIASSYDTAVSTIEKLPQAILQNQNSRRSFSHSYHSRNNSFEDLPYEESAAASSGGSIVTGSSYETSRISNINVRHTGKIGRGTYGHFNLNPRLPSVAGQGTVITSAGSKPGPVRQEGQEKDMPRRWKEGIVQAPANQEDDGLSMMTSALLNIIDSGSDAEPEQNFPFVDNVSNHSLPSYHGEDVLGSGGNGRLGLGNLNDRGAHTRGPHTLVSNSMPDYLCRPALDPSASRMLLPLQQQQGNRFATDVISNNTTNSSGGDATYSANGFHNNQQAFSSLNIKDDAQSRRIRSSSLSHLNGGSSSSLPHFQPNPRTGNLPFHNSDARRQWSGNTSNAPLNSDAGGGLQTQFYMTP